MARGTENPLVGAERGRVEGTSFVGDFVVTIDDLAACIAAPDHPARLGGTVSFPGLADVTSVSEGSLELYAADPETGTKQMRYRVRFTGRDGADYRLEAIKFIRPRRATIKEQVTAYARLYASDGTAASPTVVAAGIIVFRLRDLPAFLWSMRVEGGSRTLGLRRFLAFSRRELLTPVTARAT
jgi:hypothetical protein